MAVHWTVKSEAVHTSKATWVGPKPRDGGFALLKEAFDWARHNRTPGQMVVNFGTGGSVSDLSFVQSEPTTTPDTEEEDFTGALVPFEKN